MILRRSEVIQLTVRFIIDKPAKGKSLLSAHYNYQNEMYAWFSLGDPYTISDNRITQYLKPKRQGILKIMGGGVVGGRVNEPPYPKPYSYSRHLAKRLDCLRVK